MSLSIDTCTNAGFGRAIHRGTTGLHWRSAAANFQQLLQPRALKEPMKVGSKYLSKVICSEKPFECCLTWFAGMTSNHGPSSGMLCFLTRVN